MSSALNTRAKPLVQHAQFSVLEVWIVRRGEIPGHHDLEATFQPRGSGHREPVAVRTRCDPDMPCKRRPQVFFAVESAAPRDVFDSVVGFL
jgi:hypothetical protein